MHKQNRLKFYGLATLLSLVMMFFAQSSVFAQDVTVKGKVTNAATNEVVPGANVNVKGTTNGTITDLDGNYSITVSADATLVFSSMGFATQEIAVGNQTKIDVVLAEDITQVEEVVVVGYGTRLREEITGAVSSMNADEMKLSTAPSAVGRMQGQVSGVTVVNSNTPGGIASIHVRGLGTINDNEPLYVIDGVPANPGNNLNPNDIESISVLKDASSAAIYGTRGANGVILITTKRGKSGDKPNITFSSQFGFSKAVNQYDLLNSQEYAETIWLKAKNTGTTPPSDLYGSGPTPVLPDYLTPVGAKEGDPNTDPSTYSALNKITKANKAGTNWYDEIYQTGKSQQYDLSITGGSKNTTYAFSAGYMDQQGF